MIAAINIEAYRDALVVLGTSGVVVPLVRRLGFNPVLGYLGAGALLGPYGLGSLVREMPGLSWVTIINPKDVEGIAELGVVFLLFLIGLELSFPRLWTMRRLVFGLGGLQVILTALAIGAVAMAMGQNGQAAIILGASLSLSSTAIVLELLSREGRLATSVGRASFGVLLAQDIAVIPILMFVSIAQAGARGNVAASAFGAAGAALAAIAVILVAGRFLLRPLFRLVATERSNELFISAVLFVIVGAGVIASRAGMSMALGAFIAGLLLAETEYDKAIQATVEPFKGLLLGIFFFTVGMGIDLRALLEAPLLLAACVVGLVAFKALILIVLGRVFRLSWRAAVETGLLLGAGGEFAFVAVAAATGLIAPEAGKFVLALVSVTMAITPLLGLAGRRLSAAFAVPAASDPELLARPQGGEAHAIVIGHGRVGRVVCDLLKEHGVPYIAADSDAASVTRDRKEDKTVFYGDAVDPLFLKACGVLEATGVIVTINARETVDEIVRHVRLLRPDVLIIARARDEAHARHLYAIGASDAVPETIEASLQLSEAALVGLGVPMGPAIASVHEKRDIYRHALQKAAETAGREESYGIRAQTSGLRSRMAKPGE
jgi:CPA2 family monovalent cation:H+ antiporter-2